MNEFIDYKTASMIMGLNVIGPKELDSIEQIKFSINNFNPKIPFSEDILKHKKEDYILVMGVSKFTDGRPVTIRNLQVIFGKNPDEMEPCFYNQDWYNNETFIDKPMENKWFFIRKKVYEESRAVQPQILLKNHSFPTAICCTYAFFTAWLTLGIRLWYHDFVWCSDTDHNGDRIYVGKYHDVDGINKNGFSIHRHLELRKCYACID